MVWPTPQFSRSQVNKAGEVLIQKDFDPDQWLWAFDVLSNWRACHGYEKLDKRATYVATTKESGRLGIRDMLLGYSSAIKAIPVGTARAAFYLVQLNLQEEQKSVSIRSFARDQLERANDEYMKAEKRASDGERIQVVLVSAGSIDSLRRAYPNYFLDTHDFLRHLKRIEKAS